MRQVRPAYVSLENATGVLTEKKGNMGKTHWATWVMSSGNRPLFLSMVMGLSLFCLYDTGAIESNKHRVSIDKGDMLTLAENGKANVEIVVPEPATPTARFAAKELKTFLDQALGSDIKILRERSGATPAIILGDNRWSRA